VHRKGAWTDPWTDLKEEICDFSKGTEKGGSPGKTPEGKVLFGGVPSAGEKEDRGSLDDPSDLFI